MKEETAATMAVDSIHDLIKGRVLVRIQSVEWMCSSAMSC
jgi:hypothetical protein